VGHVCVCTSVSHVRLYERLCWCWCVCVRVCVCVRTISVRACVSVRVRVRVLLCSAIVCPVLTALAVIRLGSFSQCLWLSLCLCVFPRSQLVQPAYAGVCGGLSIAWLNRALVSKGPGIFFGGACSLLVPHREGSLPLADRLQQLLPYPSGRVLLAGSNVINFFLASDFLLLLLLVGVWGVQLQGGRVQPPSQPPPSPIPCDARHKSSTVPRWFVVWRG